MTHTILPGTPGLSGAGLLRAGFLRGGAGVILCALLVLSAGCGRYGSPIRTPAGGMARPAPSEAPTGSTGASQADPECEEEQE